MGRDRQYSVMDRKPFAIFTAFYGQTWKLFCGGYVTKGTGLRYLSMDVNCLHRFLYSLARWRRGAAAIVAVLLAAAFGAAPAGAQSRIVVVVDSLSGEPLAGVSVFDNRGRTLGMADDKGVVPDFPATAYPLTVSTLGYSSKKVPRGFQGRVELVEKTAQLPEVVVESDKHQVQHLVAYVREYSTASTYSDTVLLFREKTVDFMVPAAGVKKKYKGWLSPRVLASKSYYRFTNRQGLDSVSRFFGQHFSWSDWVGLFRDADVPAGIMMRTQQRDTIFGARLPLSVWQRSGDKVQVDVDVLNEDNFDRWVPALAGFPAANMTFDTFKLRYRLDDVEESAVFPDNVESLAVHIESTGRGRNMQRLFRTSAPIYVDTYAEIYIADKEYLTVADARKLEKDPPRGDEIGIVTAATAPELQPAIADLVARVNAIDPNAIRLDAEPDALLRNPNKNLDKKQKKGFLQKLKGLIN